MIPFERCSHTRRGKKEGGGGEWGEGWKQKEAEEEENYSLQTEAWVHKALSGTDWIICARRVYPMGIPRKEGVSTRGETVAKGPTLVLTVSQTRFAQGELLSFSAAISLETIFQLITIVEKPLILWSSSLVWDEILILYFPEDLSEGNDWNDGWW